MNIKSMEVEFDNGDKLILVQRESTFAGYNKRTLWELFYAERVEGNHESVSDDEPVVKDPHFFNVHQTEYFPMFAASQARGAFNVRMNSSNPRNESDQGWSLDDILQKK